jgi:membrane protein implicated in regulation of membrane protease activity
MEPWLWWLIAAGVLLGVEMFSGTLILAMIAVGALAGGGVAALGADPVWQILAFTAVSALMLGVVRPVAKRHVQMPRAIRTGTAALIGEYAVVVAAVDGERGRVKIGGDVWSARSYDGDAVFAVGDHVQVLEIDGATALVA